jgi:pectinesterase
MFGMPLVLALLAGIVAGAAEAPQAAAPGATLTAKNPLDLARASETLVIPAADLQKVLAAKDIRTVHVRDEAGALLLTQAVDLNDDGTFDELIFQADFKPGQTRTFALSVGERRIPRLEDFKAYGRFVRERRDDFAWENDRIAHRMYGAALETWAQEPLTSSAVDVWTKRVRRLVINDWYMVDDYHQDNGTGGDFYSAGKTRGCGGNGVWAAGRLYPSANFRNSRVLASGPIRVMFELTYEPWDVGGAKVTEVKRITLDAGHNLDRFESVYKAEGGALPTGHAVGIKKNPGSVSVTSRERGVLRTWEAFKGTAGHLGCGVIVDPAQLLEFAEADGNYLVAARLPSGQPAVYHAGFGWDKSGDFAGVDDWDRYLEEAARRLRAPIQTALAAR